MSFTPYKPSKNITIDLFDTHKKNFYHYHRVLNAKTRLPIKSMIPSSTLHTNDPMKSFEFNNNNRKLLNKLVQIYEAPSECIKKRKKRKKRKNSFNGTNDLKESSRSTFAKRQQQNEIRKQNIEMYNKIIKSKPTVGNWKQRQRSLRKLSLLTLKKTSEKVKKQINLDNAYLSVFKQNLKKHKKDKKQTENSTLRATKSLKSSQKYKSESNRQNNHYKSQHI